MPRVQPSRGTHNMAGLAPAPEPAMLWIDGVGGYLLLPGESWVVGGPGSSEPADVVVMGDLSRRAAAFCCDRGEYLLQPLSAPVRLDAAAVDRPVLLSGTHRVGIGSGIELRFTKPHPLSGSARLEMLSGHRVEPACDGVILMSDTCIVGPTTAAHIRCPQWSASLVLLHSQGRWRVRSEAALEIGRRRVAGRADLRPGDRVEGPDFALTLEPLAGVARRGRADRGG